MIQDIGPERYHNEYKNAKPKEDSRILCCRKGKLLLRHQGREISFLTYGEVKERFPRLGGECRYLFAIDGIEYFLMPELGKEAFQDLEEERQQEEPVWSGIDFLRKASPREAAFAGVTGFQLAGVVSEQALLSGLRPADAPFGNGADDVLSGLRSAGISQTESRRDRGGDGRRPDSSHQVRGKSLYEVRPHRRLYGNRGNRGGDGAKRSDGRGRPEGEKTSATTRASPGLLRIRF